MDAYEILGVSRLASDDEIKRAYRKKSLEFHPDHGGTSEQMCTLNEAYHHIDTKEHRDAYNREHSFASEFDRLAKIFGKPDVAKRFGERPVQKCPPVHGGNIELTVNIPLSVYISGYRHMEVKFSRKCECLSCSGTGASRMSMCGSCGGAGKTVTSGRKRKCTKCSGKGYIVIDKCADCDGGTISRDIKLYIDYAPHMLVYKSRGKGDNGLHGGENGDLDIRFVPVAPEGVKLSDDYGRIIVSGPPVYPEDIVLGRQISFELCGQRYGGWLQGSTVLSVDVGGLAIEACCKVIPASDSDSALYNELREMHSRK